jgi:hypothetical protein
MDEDGGKWQNMSKRVSKSVILGESEWAAVVTIRQMPLKTLGFHPKGHLTSVTWGSGP